MKKVIILASLIFGIITVNTTKVDASENEKIEINTNQFIEIDNNFKDGIESIEVQEAPKSTVNPLSRAGVVAGIRAYNKTITITYSHTNFPRTTYYSEYKYNTWYKGNLSFQKSVKVSNGYKATYTGTISIFG